MSAGPQISPPNCQIDVVDSYYQWVKGRVKILNSQRVFGGIVQARDWPFKEASTGQYYLLIEKDAPSPRIASWHSPVYTFSVRWAWLVMGTDLAPTDEAANRGDKYRINVPMQQEILNGCWPGFCEKQLWSITPDPNTNLPVLNSQSYVPSEKLWWTKPVFSEKVDANTGILFSYAQVNISAFAPAIDV